MDVVVPGCLWAVCVNQQVALVFFLTDVQEVALSACLSFHFVSPLFSPFRLPLEHQAVDIQQKVLSNRDVELEFPTHMSYDRQTSLSGIGAWADIDPVVVWGDVSQRLQHTRYGHTRNTHLI